MFKPPKEERVRGNRALGFVHGLPHPESWVSLTFRNTGFSPLPPWLCFEMIM